MLKIIAVAVVSMALTSCSGLVPHSILGSKEGGYVSINADAAGMKAFGDWNTGVINETKAAPGTKGSHYQLREAQGVQKTIRKHGGGYFQQMMDSMQGAQQ